MLRDPTPTSGGLPGESPPQQWRHVASVPTGSPGAAGQAQSRRKQSGLEALKSSNDTRMDERISPTEAETPNIRKSDADVRIKEKTSSPGELTTGMKNKPISMVLTESGRPR